MLLQRGKFSRLGPGSAVSNFADVNSATTNFTMPAGDTIITATYIAETYSLTVDFGTGDGSYTLGESASLVADAAPVGKVFLAWAGSDVSNFADVNSSSTTFTMPAGDTTLTATYVAVPFVLTVDFGTGDGSYTLGESVAIAADTAPSGQVFSAWTGSVVSNFADVNSATTTFTMTDVDTTITANYAPVGTGNAVIPAGDLTVISSSQYSIADAAGAFDGSGLSGDQHNDVYTDGWLSGPTGAAGQWIIVDLGGHLYVRSSACLELQSARILRPWH